MQRIHSADRLQMVFDNLESQIENNHPVRFIDAFVDAIELDKIGFIKKVLKAKVAPVLNLKFHLQMFKRLQMLNRIIKSALFTISFF